MRTWATFLFLGVGACSKHGASQEDPFAPPAGSQVALAPAAGTLPHATSRVVLGTSGAVRDASAIATVSELRNSLHDRALRDTLSARVGSLSDVLLYVDRRTTFEVLSAFLGVLGAAGVRSDRVELAVAGPDGRTVALSLAAPRPEGCEITFRGLAMPDASAFRSNVNDVPCVQDPGLAASVRMSTEGFEVAATGANLSLGCESIGPGVAVRGDDLPALVACLTRIKHLHGEFAKERSLVISAAPATRFDELAPVVAAVGKQADGLELFPEVTFARK